MRENLFGKSFGFGCSKMSDDHIGIGGIDFSIVIEVALFVGSGVFTEIIRDGVEVEGVDRAIKVDIAMKVRR